VLNDLTPQYAKIKIQETSAATKFVKEKARMFDSKINESRHTERLVPVLHYLAKNRELNKILTATTFSFHIPQKKTATNVSYSSNIQAYYDTRFQDPGVSLVSLPSNNFALLSCC
jgi:hypothetical protein